MIIVRNRSLPGWRVTYANTSHMEHLGNNFGHMEHLIHVSNNENNYSYPIGVIKCFPLWPPYRINRRVPCHPLPQDRTRQTEK